MYEPKHPPQLKDCTASLPGIGFSVTHTSKYIHPNDSDADPLHIHPYLEIFFRISGDVSFLVNNTLHHVPVGGAVVSAPGDVHVCVFSKPAVYDYLCLWIDADFQSPIFDFLRQDGFRSLFLFDEETAGELHSRLFSLLKLCEEAGSVLEKTAALLQILTLFVKGQVPKNSPTAIPNALQEIMDDIHHNFSRITSISELAAAHFISPATLTRWFRKYIHSSPREYLESIRLSHASSLLTGGAAVTDACIASGFGDCSHFITLFKRKFGVTPMQYKKKANPSAWKDNS